METKNLFTMETYIIFSIQLRIFAPSKWWYCFIYKHYFFQLSVTDFIASQVRTEFAIRILRSLII